MSELSETAEVNEAPEVSDEVEGMEADFESELDSKCDEYTSKGRSLEDIQRDKEELMQMREELMKYKESQEAESSTTEADDEDEYPEKVLTLRQHR